MLCLPLQLSTRCFAAKACYIRNAIARHVPYHLYGFLILFLSCASCAQAWQEALPRMGRNRPSVFSSAGPLIALALAASVGLSSAQLASWCTYDNHSSSAACALSSTCQVRPTLACRHCAFLPAAEKLCRQRAAPAVLAWGKQRRRATFDAHYDYSYTLVTCCWGRGGGGGRPACSTLQ